MNRAFPHLTLSEDDFPTEIHDILNRMDSICAGLAEDTAQNKNLEELNSVFWQFVIAYIPTLITEEDKNDFSIPTQFHDSINFGYISNVICPHEEQLFDEIRHKTLSEKGNYEIIYLHKWIKEKYERVLRLDVKYRVEKEFQDAEYEFARFPDRIEECYSRRRAFKKMYPRSFTAMKISEEIEARLPIYLDMKKKIELSMRISTDERINYVKITEEITKFREYRAKEQQGIGSYVPQYELMRLDREIEQIMVLKREAEARLAKAQQAVEKDQKMRKNISVAFCREKMAEELRRIRSESNLLSRRSRVKQCSLLIDVECIPTPHAVIDALEEILEVDQTIFLQSSSRKKKFPRIVVLPAFGNGAYDVEDDILYIPTRPQKGLLEAVSAALIEYHLDSQSGACFRESYLTLNKNKRINSSIQLRENIIRDYIGWVTLEAKGYQALDQETKGWFLENVAPPIFALKETRNSSVKSASIAEVHDLIEKHEEGHNRIDDDFNYMLKVGMAYWRVRHYIKANYAFTGAAKLNAQSKNACYNAALSCFKTGQHHKARDYWRHYLSLDKSSFWTVRVQKFLNTIH